MLQPRSPPKDLARRLAVAVTLPWLVLACSGASAEVQAPPLSPEPPSAASIDEEAGAPDALEPVRAGRYRLSLSATCRSRPATATGVLTLQPMSGADGTRTAPLAPGSSEATLLWGQTDLDLHEFLNCFGRTATPSGEPIHPSVLVEVLRWDGERQHQVFLVSTEPRGSSASSSGGGIALWVEHVQLGHIAGVWSRWELMGRGEGRWEADLLGAR